LFTVVTFVRCVTTNFTLISNDQDYVTAICWFLGRTCLFASTCNVEHWIPSTADM